MIALFNVLPCTPFPHQPCFNLRMQELQKSLSSAPFAALAVVTNMVATAGQAFVADLRPSVTCMENRGSMGSRRAATAG